MVDKIAGQNQANQTCLDIKKAPEGAFLSIGWLQAIPQN